MEVNQTDFPLWGRGKFIMLKVFMAVAKPKTQPRRKWIENCDITRGRFYMGEGAGQMEKETVFHTRLILTSPHSLEPVRKTSAITLSENIEQKVEDTLSTDLVIKNTPLTRLMSKSVMLSLIFGHLPRPNMKMAEYETVFKNENTINTTSNRMMMLH